jgi:hypothetical protein
VAAIRRAVDLGLLRRSGASFTVPSPKLLSAGEELVALGMPLDVVLDLAEALQQDLDVTAARFVSAVIGQFLGDADSATLPPPEKVSALAGIVQRLRPLASSAVEASFAQAMERQVAEAFSQIAGRSMTAGRAPAPSGPGGDGSDAVGAGQDVPQPPERPTDG